jgi:hypothetical protein
MSAGDKQAWKERYEQLRHQALGQSSALTSDRWGLGLLVRKGLASWMRAWRDPSSGSEPTSGQRVPASICPPGSWQQEVTVLLANMALSHCQRSTPPSR